MLCCRHSALICFCCAIYRGTPYVQAAAQEKAACPGPGWPHSSWPTPFGQPGSLPARKAAPGLNKDVTHQI